MYKNSGAIKGFIFEYELLNMIKHHPDFSNIKYEYQLNDAVRPVDITATSNGFTYIIECKALTAFSNYRLEEIIKELVLYKNVLDTNFKIVLAFPGEMSKIQQSKLNCNMIEVWDIYKLAEIFSKQIALIETSELKQLFLSIKKNVKTIEDVLVEKLNLCPKGDKHWSAYQKLIADIFECLFFPPLGRPITELSDYVKVNRRDIIMPNYSENGFWFYMRQRYRADYLVVDAKNHSTRIDKSAILQMGNYLKDYGVGMFGVITYRSGLKGSVIHTQRELWVAQQKLVIFLTDTELESMLKSKKNSGYPEEIIKQKIEDFRLKL